MRTPREAFQKSGKLREYEAILALPAFEMACHYALLQLQSVMRPNISPDLPTDPYVGLDANAQMTGAQAVLEILQTLNLPEEKITTPKRKTLHYGDRSPTRPASDTSTSGSAADK